MMSSFHGGIVLAAGASRRMGSPKALLETRSGIHLAVHQANLLEQTGCNHVGIILGSDAKGIRAVLEYPHIYENPDWETGRTSSVQVGLRAMPHLDGYFILPVDTAGITITTLETMRDVARTVTPKAVRPTYRGKPGHLAWISRELADEFLQIESTDGLRLNERIDPVALQVEVDDAAILHNVNRPDEWETVREQMKEV